MKNTNLKPIVLTEDNFLKKDKSFWMDAETLGRHLGYQRPEVSVRIVYNRNFEELDNFSRVVEMDGTGGKRTKRIFSEQGCYVVAMLARTDRAKAFRKSLAEFLVRHRKQYEEMQKISTTLKPVVQHLTSQTQYYVQEFARVVLYTYLTRKKIDSDKIARLYDVRDTLTDREMAAVLRIKTVWVGLLLDLEGTHRGDRYLTTRQIEDIRRMLWRWV